MGTKDSKAEKPADKSEPSEKSDKSEAAAEAKTTESKDPHDRATAAMEPLAPEKIETSPIAKVDPSDLATATDDNAKREPPLVVAESPRARTQTVTSGQQPMSAAPPEMPTAAPPVQTAMGGTEDPTHMPGAKDIPAGHPNDPASAPGTVPPGDSRSLRRGGLDFALVYRQDTFVISRTGAIGTRGVWRVVEYPTSASAGHAYAKECSRFVSEGFSDYRP